MEREWRPAEGDRVRIVVPLKSFYLRRNTGRVEYVSSPQRLWVAVWLDDPALRMQISPYDNSIFFQSIVLSMNTLRPIGDG